MKTFFITVVVAFVFIIALIFGAQNEQQVTINYFIAQGQYKLPTVLSVVFLAGFLLSWLFASYQILKLRMQIRRANKQITSMTEAEGASIKEEL